MKTTIRIITLTLILSCVMTIANAQSYKSAPPKIPFSKSYMPRFPRQMKPAGTAIKVNFSPAIKFPKGPVTQYGKKNPNIRIY